LKELKLHSSKKQFLPFQILVMSESWSKPSQTISYNFCANTWLLSNNIKTNIQNYNFACSSFVWSSTLWEECRLMVFENRVLRRTFEPKTKWWEVGENCVIRSFIICTPCKMLEYSKVFSGDQPYQCGFSVHHFRDCLCLHHQELMWWQFDTLAVFIQRYCLPQHESGVSGQSWESILFLVSYRADEYGLYTFTSILNATLFTITPLLRN
jgi:hypothetical protein